MMLLQVNPTIIIYFLHTAGAIEPCWQLFTACNRVPIYIFVAHASSKKIDNGMCLPTSWTIESPEPRSGE